MEYKYNTIKVENEDGIVTITLNRPEKKNAMSPELHREMDDALSKLEEDEEARVLILTGAGDSFVGGMDLEKCFLEPYHEGKLYEVNAACIRWFKKLRDFPKPTIASVNGWCFGGGFVPLAGCDIAIASEKAMFGLSEINMGFFPGGGTTWAVAYSVHPKLALYLILTGDTIDGSEAARIGLVSKCVPHERLAEETWDLALKLKKRNPVALRLAKEVYKRSRWMEFPESLDWETAKMHELSYLTKTEWIDVALTQFKDREYKPGLEAYKREKE